MSTLSKKVVGTVVASTLLLLAIAGPANAWTPTSGQLHWKQLSPGGEWFLNYDGKKNKKRTDRDWPVTLIFWNNGLVDKVKDKFDDDDTGSFKDTGSRVHMGYKNGPYTKAPRYDGDKGKKTKCIFNESETGPGTGGGAKEDYHYRVYGPPGDYFSDPRYGKYTVATTHVDHGEDEGACGGRRYFGRSERVENHIGNLASSLGLPVRTDHYPLGNHEDFQRVDANGETHIWSNGGSATTIRFP